MPLADPAPVSSFNARSPAWNGAGNRLSETAEVLRARTRIALGIILFAIVVSAASDAYFLRWPYPLLELMQFVLFGAVAGCCAALRRVVPERVAAIAVLSACAVYLTVATLSIITNDDATTPLEFTALAVGTASLLPWGMLAQLVTVMVAAVALMANVAWVRGGFDLAATYSPLVGAWIAFGASVFIADMFARGRFLTEEIERQRDAAEGALRAAHAELEQRVAQRTAELQGAKEALEKEMAERHQLEDVVRQREAKLAQATRLSSVGQIAVEIAHELNQPLGAIANFARGCARHLHSNTASTTELTDAVEQIAAQALRAGDIIRRIAGVARKPASPAERLQLNDLVHDVTRLMRAETHRLGVTLCLELAPQLPTVEVDRLQIEEVMVNLIRNGCEAMATCASAREISVCTSMAGPAVVEVDVRDSGVGLPPSSAERLFEPFFTTKPEGLGLGLSISRSIVEAHGGALQAVANIDVGTTFRFRLPAAQAASTSPQNRTGSK